MDDIKVGIVEPDNFSVSAIDAMSKYAVIEKYNNEDLDKFVADKDILFVRLKYQINDLFLKNAKKLKYICSPTTGLNHITTKKDIKIISLKNENQFLNSIRATPEHVIGLTLSLLRNYKYAFLSTSNRTWNRDLYRGYELYDNSIGIIGMGRIGKIITKYFSAFSSKIYYYDIKDNLDCTVNAKRVNSIEELIKESNIIILCVDYKNENDKFFNKQYFDKMKNKFFINTSRGELIDEDDLINFINDNHFLGVGIDVLSSEAAGLNNLDKILDISEGKNVIITPHIGGATYTSMHRTEEFITSKLIDIITNNCDILRGN